MIRAIGSCCRCEITLLIKVLFELEGTSRLSEQNFTLIEVLKPTRKK